MATNKTIRELTGATTLGGLAYLTGVDVNGNNVKILVSDFLANVIGSTGSLESLGTGTDILSIAATVNRIRKLAAGQGISLSIDATQAIAIASTLVSGITGAKVLDIDTSTVKSLIAGTGIQLAQGTDAITVTATGTTAATDVVIINEESDFPVQDGTTITLSAGIIFEIGSAFSTAKRFICEEGALLTARNAKGPVLTYSGTAAMFSGTDICFTINRIKITSPNASKTFDFTASSANKFLDIIDVIIVDTPKLGTLDSMTGMNCAQVNAMAADQGWDLTGTFTEIIQKECLITTTSATFIGYDLGTATIVEFELADSLYTGVAGAIMLQGAASSANIPSGDLGKVDNNTVTGGIVALNTITQSDIRWDFLGNNTIENTRIHALLTLSGNATETTISGAGTAVLVAGTWVVAASSQMTGTTGGRATFNHEKQRTEDISVSATLKLASGSTKTVSVHVAINGSVITAAKAQGICTSSQSISICVPWENALTTTDYIEIFVSNDSDTVNIIVTDAIIRVG